jgi:hypothetical protein
MASPRVVLLASLAYLSTNKVEGFAPVLVLSLSPCGICSTYSNVAPSAGLHVSAPAAAANAAHASTGFRTGTSSVSTSSLHATFIDSGDEGDNKNEDGEEEEEGDDEEMEPDPYMENAASEFLDGGDSTAAGSSSLAPMGATSLDWGGALDTLRDRVDDIESGKSGPSNALFRLMSAETPNQAIGKFIQEADPSVVQAMSGAVSSLLGGLSNPSTGIEVVVKASGDKLGNLCFQLMMTGYLFRNCEYVLALKDLIGLRGSANVVEFRKAFDKIDSDNSGYIEVNEIEALLSEVYGDDVPSYETRAFMEFFDSNRDGRISWSEFETGLGATYAKKSNDESSGITGAGAQRALPGSSAVVDDYDDDDEEEDYPDFEQLFGRPSVEGKVQVELKNGKTIEVDASQYMQTLKDEAEALKEALRMERGEPQAPPGLISGAPIASGDVGGIAGYIASLEGDVKSLTEGIAPETVETMKLLIKFVLEGGGKKKKLDPDQEMELPGSALQQLALWQLVLGYRLRENEAKGEYKKLLDS